MDNDTLSNNSGGVAPDAPTAPEVGATPTAEATTTAGSAPAADAATPTTDLTAGTSTTDTTGGADLSAPDEPAVTVPEPTADTSATPVGLGATDATSTTDTAAGTTPLTPNATPAMDTSTATEATPTADSATPLVDTSAMGAVDTTTAPANPLATDAAAPANPFAPDTAGTGGALDASAPLVNTNPILANAPEAKASPILNSAPAIVKKFDLKYMIPIIVLAVLVLALGGFLIYEEMVGKPNAIQEAKTTATPVVNATYNTSDDSDAEDTAVVVPFESNQSLNTSENSYTLTADSGKGIAAASDDGTSVTFSVNWTEAKTAYADAKLTGTGTNDYTMDLDQAVTTIFYTGAVNGGKTEFFLFLMEDGTVEYVNITDGLSAKEFESSRVSRVTDIVRLMSATSGNGTVALAQKSDGTYYDVTAIIAD